MTATRTDLLTLTRTLLRCGFYLSSLATVIVVFVLAVFTFGDPSILPAIGPDPSLGLTPEQHLIATRVQLVVGLVAVVLTLLVLRLLLAIVDSARSGDPFVPENGARLRRIGWLMFAGNLAVMAAVLITETATGLSDIHNDLVGDAPFPGIMTILLVFVLARIFETGSRMRTELQETV